MPTISKVASAEQVPKKQVTVDMATATVAATPLPANIEELQQAVEVAAKTAAKEYSKAIEVLESYVFEIETFPIHTFNHFFAPQLQFRNS